MLASEPPLLESFGVIWRVYRITFVAHRGGGLNKDELYASCDLLRGDADESRRKRATSHAARISPSLSVVREAAEDCTACHLSKRAEAD